MILSQKPDIKIISQVLLIWLILSVAGGIATYFQTEYQLTSPLIPRSSIDLIARPYLLASLGCSVFAIAALLFYFFGRYQIVILLCSIAILARIYYINWGA